MDGGFVLTFGSFNGYYDDALVGRYLNTGTSWAYGGRLGTSYIQSLDNANIQGYTFDIGFGNPTIDGYSRVGYGDIEIWGTDEK